MAFQVHDATSVNTDEYNPDTYVIPFAPELIKFILDNQKLTTYRYGSKYNYLGIGDKVSIQDSKSKRLLARQLLYIKAI